MISTPLVSADALAAHLEDVRVLDCRSGPGAHAAYLERHVRGALHVDLERDLSAHDGPPERGGRHPLPRVDAWAATLGTLGITPSTWVVLYDDKGGANAAARAWWMLRAVGHERVAVLDGGFAAAERVLPMQAGDVAVPSSAPYPVTAWQSPMRDIDEVARAMRDASAVLVDVRAPERYRGEVEPLDPIAGHIPGAINVPLTESLDAHGRFRDRDALRAHFRARLGDAPIERVIVSCGSGVTACHTLLALEHAGLPGAALYVGSWSEWCRSGRERAEGSAPR
jgi:thiosulfate/3-mercaptopyruvate sulfurtransferase